MYRIIRFIFTIIQFVLVIDNTKQSKIKYATIAFKTIGNAIKKPIMKTIGNTIKNPMNMLSQKNNNIKNLASGLDKFGEKYLKTRLSAGTKFIQDLGKKGIHKYKAPQVTRGANNLVRTEGKKNIQMRSAELMRGKGLESILNSVSKSKPQAPFLFAGGLMKLAERNVGPVDCADYARQYKQDCENKIAPKDQKPNEKKGSVFVMRHSERCDKVWDKVERDKIEYKYDVPLTTYGHSLAQQAGGFFKEHLDRQINELKQKNFKFRVVSSPYYRCLQTSLQVCKAIGYENIYEKKLFIEDAVEEWYHSIEVPKEVRKERFWGNNWSEEKNKELFSDISPAHNTIFDYKKHPFLNVEYDEGMTDRVTKRFSQAYDSLIEKSEENPEVANIVISHGASIESLQEVMSQYEYPDYCMINQLESAGKNEDGQSTYAAVIAGYRHVAPFKEEPNWCGFDPRPDDYNENFSSKPELHKALPML